MTLLSEHGAPKFCLGKLTIKVSGFGLFRRTDKVLVSFGQVYYEDSPRIFVSIYRRGESLCEKDLHLHNKDFVPFLIIR
jgi:hypothetical protein